MNEPIGFEFSVSARDDGTLEAAYIRLRRAPVARTEEVLEDGLLADYDRQGNLVGIEILSPVKLSSIVRLVDEDRREPFRRFVRRAAPEEFLTV